MSNLIAGLPLLWAVTLGVGVVPATADLKCEPRAGGDPEMPEVILIIDDEPLDVPLPEWDQTQYDIDHLEIVCWRFVEELYGIEVRSGAVFVITRDWENKILETDSGSLARLIAAQDRHLEDHGMYAVRLAELDDYEPPRFVQVHMRRTADGWAARVQHEWTRHTCFAFVGTPPAEWDATRPPTEPEFSARSPQCFYARYVEEAA